MRKVILVTLTISVLTIAGCKHAPMAAPMATSTLETIDVLRANCKSTGVGNKNKKKPLVCISLFPGGAFVNPVVIPASKLDNLNQPNRIRFVSRPALGTADSFRIELKGSGCVAETTIDCPRGDCELEVLQNAVVHTECAYSVVLDRVEDTKAVVIKLDPIVIIDTN